MCIVSTIPEKCKRCYTCVRECPAKAIKVENGQAHVIEERCIACGYCVKVCAQEAKRIRDSTAIVGDFFRDEERPVYACLAPSFPAAFPDVRPGQLLAAVRRLGFDHLWEVAYGAELITPLYLELFHNTQHAAGAANSGPSGNPNLRAFQEARRQSSRVITSPCPAVVAYVEKYVPHKRSLLAPIVSPMVATARAIRKSCDEQVRVVFIGPCIAKKKEAASPDVVNDVDAVLTFGELDAMFANAGVRPAAMVEESTFDGPCAHLGRSYAISGGLLRTAGLSADILDRDILVAEGKDRVLPMLTGEGHNTSGAIFFDLLFCEGCINGPVMPGNLGMFARKDIVADYVTQGPKKTESAPSLDLDLSRAFTGAKEQLPTPSEEEVTAALAVMKKVSRENQLNCGACGYHTCREKAIAVCQGMAEPEMCLPYLIDELEVTLHDLRSSHDELASTQHRLVQTERIASLGQLSAGIAHEINNPLGTILLYSHMLLKGLADDDPRQEDFRMIVSEADRCKNIARGLLAFARQSRASKATTDLCGLIGAVVAATARRDSHIAVRCELGDELPPMWMDAGQIKQMLINLVENAMDASAAGQEVQITARPLDERQQMEILVRDQGCGIPEENMGKLFTPFFTTKEVGKGTGMGLAIAYGIVKMHSGDIDVESKPGQGTTVRVSLPMGTMS